MMTNTQRALNEIRRAVQLHEDEEYVLSLNALDSMLLAIKQEDTTLRAQLAEAQERAERLLEALEGCE